MDNGNCFYQTGQILTPVWDKTKVHIDWPSSLANCCRTPWVQVPQDQVSPHLHSPQQGYQSGRASLSGPGSHTSCQFSYQVPPWGECPSVNNGRRKHSSPRGVLCTNLPSKTPVIWDFRSLVSFNVCSVHLRR